MVHAASAVGVIPPTQVLLMTSVAVPSTGLVAIVFLARAGERLSEYFVKPLIVLVSEGVTHSG